MASALKKEVGLVLSFALSLNAVKLISIYEAGLYLKKNKLLLLFYK